MKQILKNLAVAIMVFSITVLPLLGATYTLTIPNASTLYSLAFTNQIYTIREVVVANAGTGPVNVAFFDAESTNQTYVRGAFTNTTSYTTNYVTVFTNFSGMLQTNTNSGIWSYAQSFLAMTNSRARIIPTMVVGATNTLTYTPTVPPSGGFGLVVTNTAGTNVTVTVTYDN